MVMVLPGGGGGGGGDGRGGSAGGGGKARGQRAMHGRGAAARITKFRTDVRWSSRVTHI